MTLRFEQPLILLLLLLLPLLLPVALYHAERSVRGRRIAASVVRLILVASAVIALAGPTIVRETDRLATIFLVDASDSVGPNGVAVARDYIKSALATMPDEDIAGIVVFGDNALVERSLSEDPELGPILSRPRTGYSDLAGAVRLGLALFPEGSARRLVLISDGQETKGDLGAAAAAAAASGVEISTRTIAAARGDEALVSDLRAPARAREGEAMEIAVTVQSTVAGPARLRLFVDGDLVREQGIDLKVGDNRYGFTIPPIGAGFHRFKAEVAAGADTFWQNNSASAYTDVKGRARVLILEGTPDEGANIAAALRAGGYVVDVQASDRAPANLAELVPYDAIVLVNTPVEMIGARAAVLQSYARDLGRGLVVVGGDSAYGPGGYAGTALEELLPVRMELRNGIVNPPVSLVFAIDKSGSMSAGDGGVSNMDLAKEAAFRAVKLLQPQDEIGIAAFDGSAYIVADRKPVREQTDIASRIGSLQASGGTDIRSGLEAALGLQLGSDGRVRHIILVTDGQSDYNFDDLIAQMTASGITLSVIGVGSGAAPYLPQLAAAGNGRYYAATDPAQLPEIFLQETRLALRSYFIEGDIGLRFGAATPITEGIESAPNLLGYVGTTAKPTAQTGIVSADGDPLLAQWQYGLGRVVAWTSDAKGQWATNWLTWSEFTRFWSRAVGWTVATAPQDLQLTTRTEGDRTILTVDALDPTGAYRNGLVVGGTTIGPDGARRDVTLRQIAPGRYEGDLGTLLEGAHLLAIVARDGQGTAQAGVSGGLIVPYSPEYALPRGDRATLTQARELTGGMELVDPAAAFAHTLPLARQSTAIWPPFLIVAILLLPFDIGLRRLLIGRRDLQLVAARLFRRPAPPEPTLHERGSSSATMGNLLAARERTQSRWSGRKEPPAAKTTAETPPMVARPTPPPAPPPASRPASQAATPPPVAAPSAQPAAATRPSEAVATRPASPPVTPQTGGTLGQLLKAKEQAKRKRD